jgi:hypothetical protein
MFELHTFMIGVHLALLYDYKEEIRQAVVDKLNLKLKRATYDPEAPHLTVVPLIARPQVWLSGLILNAVGQAAGKDREKEMERQVRQHLGHFQSMMKNLTD